jgi:hypothetical protein
MHPNVSSNGKLERVPAFRGNSKGMDRKKNEGTVKGKAAKDND